MLDHQEKTKRKPNRLLIEAEQIKTLFLSKGREIAQEAKEIFIKGGLEKGKGFKAVRKFAEKHGFTIN